LYTTSINITNCILEGSTSGGGIYFVESSLNTEITYGDFYNNSGGNFTGPSIPEWLGQIVTTNANGDSCDTFFNIFEDPLFVDPASGNFHLQADSPCIDAGDPNSPLDPDSTIADIGAFYFDQSLGIELESKPDLPKNFAVTGVYPNPFNPETVIRFQLPVASNLNLTVYDVSGRVVAELVNSNYDAGIHEITFDGSGLPSGVYIYRLTAGEYTASGKMVLLK